MSSHKNLLAAKTALGLDGGGSPASGGGSRRTQGGGSLGSSGRSLGRDSAASSARSWAIAPRSAAGGSDSASSSTAAMASEAGASARSKMSFTSRKAASALTSSSARRGGDGGGSSRHSSIHELSVSARMAARRAEYGESDASVIFEQGSMSTARARSRLGGGGGVRSAANSSSVRTRSSVAASRLSSGGGSQSHLTPGSAPPRPGPSLAYSRSVVASTPGAAVHVQGSVNDASTLEDGSELNSLMGGSGPGSESGAAGRAGAGHGVGAARLHLERSRASLYDVARRTDGGIGVSGSAGGGDGKGSFGASSESKLNNSDSEPVLGWSSSTFNAYESKVGSTEGRGAGRRRGAAAPSRRDNDGSELMASIQEGSAYNDSSSTPLTMQGGLPFVAPSGATRGSVRSGSGSGGGGGSVIQDGSGASPWLDDNGSAASSSATSYPPGRGMGFAPRRFREMRALLSAITPLQIEALMLEIFGDNPRSMPPGWGFTARKSRSRRFRKDAYLSEMSLSELQRYAADKEVGGMEGCATHGEAMDLIAVEFERLVSRHQQGDDGRGDDAMDGAMDSSLTYDSMSHDDELGTSMQGSVMSYVSLARTGQMAEEGANLRLSLRACSLPELRLVAERLRLDHASCTDKASLILMIEESMDMSSAGGGSSITDDSRFADQHPIRQDWQDQPPPPPPLQRQLENEESSSYYSEQERHHQQQCHQQQHHEQQPGQGEGGIEDEYYPEQHGAEQYENSEDFRDRRVQFTRDCKEDTSHLIPKREKGGSWQSFVVGAEDGGSPIDTDYGEDVDAVRHLVHPDRDGDDDGGGMDEGGVKRRKRGSGGDSTDDDTVPSRSCCGRCRIPSPGRLTGMSFRGKRLKLLGVIVVLIVAAVTLSLLLIKGEGGDADFDLILPDPGNPFFVGGGFGSSHALPSARPSASPTEEEAGSSEDGSMSAFDALFGQPSDSESGQPLASTGAPSIAPSAEESAPGFSILSSPPVATPGEAGFAWTDSPSRGPVATPTPTAVAPRPADGPRNYCGRSEVEVEATCGTTAPTCDDGDPPCPGGTFCWNHACVASEGIVTRNYCGMTEEDVRATCATVAPTCGRDDPPCPPGTFCFGNVVCGAAGPSASPTPPSSLPPTPRHDTPDPTEGWRDETLGPTPLSPYPLKGPFVEPSMKIVLYGISELNHMGRTQWKMLTAAYIEQFFNMEGSGTDAIQNIVFDVQASLEVDEEKALDRRRDLRGRYQGCGSPCEGRELRAGLILTFTMTLSYRSFSSSLGAGAVSERPFYDEEHRVGYAGFLEANNAAAHMGEILGVSAIFRGDSVPETPTVVAAAMRPTASPLFTIPEFPIPQPTTDRPRTDAPVAPIASTRKGTPRFAEKTPPPTPLHTPLPTPPPSGRPTAPPTPTPSERPTPRATPSPSKRPASQSTPLLPKRITSPPTLLLPKRTTPQPTPSPTKRELWTTFPPTPKPTPQPTEKATAKPTTPRPTGKPTSPPTAEPTAKPISAEKGTMTHSRSPVASRPSEVLTLATAASVATLEPTDAPRKRRTRPPTARPSPRPTQAPAGSPTHEPTALPTEYCASPVSEPICPLLTEPQCCRPMCAWDPGVGKCFFVDKSAVREVEWVGEFEVGQTHVVKARGETRHAPRIIAHREAELIFTPGGLPRRLGSPENESLLAKVAERMEFLSTVYLVVGGGKPILDASAQQLVDDSGAVFSLPIETPNVDIVLDLNSLRLVEEVSIALHGDSTIGNAKLGLHYDDGRGEEGDEGFIMPESGWMWLDFASPSDGRTMENISIKIPARQARYVTIKLEGGTSYSSSHWGFARLEVRGNIDGLSPDSSLRGRGKAKPITRAISPSAPERSYAPPSTASVLLAVYSPSGRLIGATTARDPSRQRGILERRLAFLEIQDYSESIWSTTLPYNWVDEGNIVLIGCVDQRRPKELLVHRIEFSDLAQFSEHTITRTKLAIFGDGSEVTRLDHSTHEAKRLVRNLYSVMPVAELKWTDTDLWHLPYVVILGGDGRPALVKDEEERRAATGEGHEISWSVLKNHLTIRHSLAQTGRGLSTTSEDASNSPYASGTSVFMGWSLSKPNENGEWEWEDLGYWDTLAAAAWTGWCLMKPGDECSNYFIHEMGHAQTMQHFGTGAAANWGIADEYPKDGKHMSHHPWGYDTVSRQFRTWFDPFQGDGKLDPLNGAGEGPTSDQCFTQYTPYQAKKSQEWASSAPILLSASSSDVSEDGAYKFNPSTHQYSPLGGTKFFTDAVGEAAMLPDKVGIPVITLIGTIGRDRAVCQTYPALRSRLGNTFELPDPFSPGLPSAFDGAAYYIEIRYHGGRTERGLIAVRNNLTKKSLQFFSFNVAVEHRPIAVGLYHFTDGSYPNLTPHSSAEILHLRPTELQAEDPLLGLPPLLKVGRGWLGDSNDIILERFCVTSDDCSSSNHNVEWRSDVASNDVIYTSLLAPERQSFLGASIFRVPVTRGWDTAEYSVTILATRFFNGGSGSSPLLELPPSEESSSDIDATHGIRIVVPWEMNGSLPAGTYHSVPGAMKISAQTAGHRGDSRHLLDLEISLNLATITRSPTRSPTKKPSPGPTLSPVQVRFYIDWNLFTCVTDGESTEWAPAHVSKEDCCHEHMAYEFASCMQASSG